MSALPVVWRAVARNRFLAIIGAISDRDAAAADRMRRLIEAAVLPLADHPYLFQSGRVPGTRELVAHPNYIIVYRVTTSRVEIVTLLHARQQYP